MLLKRLLLCNTVNVLVQFKIKGHTLNGSVNGSAGWRCLKASREGAFTTVAGRPFQRASVAMKNDCW